LSPARTAVTLPDKLFDRWIIGYVADEGLPVGPRQWRQQGMGMAVSSRFNRVIDAPATARRAFAAFASADSAASTEHIASHMAQQAPGCSTFGRSARRLRRSLDKEAA
jgi:hypothetical protein